MAFGVRTKESTSFFYQIEPIPLPDGELRKMGLDLISMQGIELAIQFSGLGGNC
jgi:hypothetical protein